jgi:CubicO group peptidase (beta-lactamase class C family)
MFAHYKFIAAVMIVLTLVAACGGAEPSPTATQTPVPPSSMMTVPSAMTVTATPTPTPTEMPSPTPTLTPTPAPTEASSPTPTLTPTREAAEAVYPGATWQQVEAPEELGWSSNKLAEAQAFAEHLNSTAVMIVHHGTVIQAWGDVEHNYLCHSMRKSLMSALFGIYVTEGSIDTSMTLEELGIDDYTPLTSAEKQATVADLLKARSGVYIPAAGESPQMKASRPERGSYAPDTFWYYNNWDFNALGTIFDQETGEENIYQAFKTRIADPIGMQDYPIEMLKYDYEPQSMHPYYGFLMSTRDLARFGLLLARGGRWEDEQIIPGVWVTESITSYSDAGAGGGYGYMWWIATAGRHLANVNVPDGAFSARGYGGHYVLAVPQWDLVIVHRFDTFSPGGQVSDSEFGYLVRLILAAGPEPLHDGIPDTSDSLVLSEEVLASLVGQYSLSELSNAPADFVAPQEVSIELHSQDLVIVSPGDAFFALTPVTPTQLRSVADDSLLVEIEMDGEEVLRVELLYQNAVSLVYTPKGHAQPIPKPSSPPEVDAEVWKQFEAKLEYLRQQMKIPGFSAAVVKDQELVWAKGFGYADLENGIEATPDTPYHLASVTKPIAATLIMQLVEEGVLDLDDPVSEYGVELESEGTILVRHLLTHTSEGVPGTVYKYNGDRYCYLGRVIEGATGKSFTELLHERILGPLGMTNSGPNYPQCQIAFGQGPSQLDWDNNYLQINQELPRPYQLDPSYDIVEGAYPSAFNPAAGLISTVVDLAKFDIALNQNVLLDEETKARMFEPAFSTYSGQSDLMYGLGWFIEEYMGTRLVWHSGRWAPSISSLYLKVPEENLTFIIMANTTYLNTPYPFGYGDTMYCTPALAFYETFVFPQQYGETVPEVNWEADARDLVDQLGQITNSDVREVLERELWSYRQLFASVGKKDLSNQLRNVHRRAYTGSLASKLDAYMFRGVDYYPVVSEQVQLTGAEQERLVGTYISTDMPEIQGVDLPLEFSVETSQGKLRAVDPEGCVDLIAITPTRFATPSNLGLFVEFFMNGKEVEHLTVEVGEIEIVYKSKE